MDDKLMRKDIIEELDFEPSLDSADIGVAVEAGVVTLTGHVRTYSEKLKAIETVELVRDVKSIADEIEVRPTGTHITADDEIAKPLVTKLEWNTSVPDDRICSRVKNGWVTLEGEVEWRFQSDAAERAAHRLSGVTGVSNHIRIKPSIKVPDVHNRISQAFHRDAELDASGIRVEVRDGTVTLEGKVCDIGVRRTAERAAWAVPGVSHVVDHLTIQ